MLQNVSVANTLVREYVDIIPCRPGKSNIDLQVFFLKDVYKRQSLTYGESPSERLTDSLGVLFDRLEDFTNQFNTMATQGLADAQAVQNSLSAVQDRVHAAGTEGMEDFRSMSDSLYQYTTGISGSLDQLREDLGDFSDEAEDALQDALNESCLLYTSGLR